MIVRKIVDFPDDVSFFLLGPRQTGKTTALLNFLKEKIYWHVNLLESEKFYRYSKNPEFFKEDFAFQLNVKKIQYVFVDEVQKIPILLDEIHQLIESNKKIHFILSGSSARKLKRGGANMLGGRAVLRRMFPFSYIELDKEFNLDKVLQFGSLPGIYFDSDKLICDKLKSYVDVYLKEEIMAEGIVRNIGSFHRFLDISAQHSAELLSYENIARECQIDSKTVKNYFQILEDTHIGLIIPVWNESIRKQIIKHPKFYFFDNGVLNTITSTITGKLHPELRGKLFEQWIINELNSNLSQTSLKIYYWRTKSGNEVDVIISKNNIPIFAIEIKAKKIISNKDLSGLKSFSEEYPMAQLIVVCEEVNSRIHDGIEILNYRDFFDYKILEIQNK